MLDIIILGFVLFIVGIAGTMLYDKYKLELAKHKEEVAKRKEMYKQMRSMAPPKVPRPTATPRPGPKSSTTISEIKKTRTAVARMHKANSLPTEEVTIEQLIAEIEKMKKRL